MEDVLELRRAAEAGNPEAQFRLAEVIDEELLDPEARMWCERAATLGHAPACMELCFYEIEFGNDTSSGIKWYRRARELGHPHDGIFLGLYSYWDGTVESAMRQARRGDSDAQRGLGGLYAQGMESLPSDLIHAYAWYSISGCAEREVRSLEAALDSEELKRAKELSLALAVEVHERQKQTVFSRIWSVLRRPR